MSKYRKFIVAVIGVVVSGLVVVYKGNPDVQVLVSVLSALGVYVTPNNVN